MNAGPSSRVDNPLDTRQDTATDEQTDDTESKVKINYFLQLECSFIFHHLA